MKLIIDSTAFLDVSLPNERPRHAAAVAAFEVIRKNGWQPRIPCHTVIEISTALRHYRQIRKTVRIYSGFGGDGWFGTVGIPIDAAFLRNYFDPSLPYIKAGDYIYLCIAKKEPALLLTNGDKLTSAARLCGVEAIGVEAFAAKFK